VILEIEAALRERRSPAFNKIQPAEWVVAIDELFVTSRLEAAEYGVRQLHAAYPRLAYARSLCGLFDRLPSKERTTFTDDLTKDLQIVPHDGAETVLFLFCGNGHRLGMPLALIHRWLAQIPVSLVYLRDFRKLYYLAGVASLGSTRDETLEAMHGIVASLGGKRIACYGSSSGGFAALHYGLDLQAQAVACLSGPTNLSPEFNAHTPRMVAVEKL